MNIDEVILLNKVDKKLDKTPSVGDFQNICRVCLRTLITNECKALQDEHYKLSIKSLLEAYTFLKVPEENDPLPQNICTHCIRFLVEMHTFRCTRMVNEDVLQKVIKKYNKDMRESLAMHDYANNTQEGGEEAPLNLPNGQLEILLPEVEPPPSAQPIIWLSREISDEKLGIFKCKDCQVEFPDRSSLLQHRREAQHWKNAATQCTECGKFVNRSRFIHHLKTHSKEKPFQCELCSVRTTTKQHLKRHMLIHTGEKPYQCNICGRSFRQYYALQSHKTIHGENFESHRRVLHFDNIICQICQQGYESTAKYIQHVKEEHNISQIGNCKIENGEAKIEIFECPMPDCNEQLIGEELLNIHMADQHRSYPCNVCGKVFRSKSNLKTHMWVHTGEKHYKCEVCGKAFVQYSALSMHMHIHNGIKRYTCKYCSRAFRQPNHLKHHIRTHTGEKPYKCEYCGRCFALNGNLTVHKRTHTGETPYRCTVCKKGFIDSSSLKKHVRGHVEYHVEQLEVEPEMIVQDDKVQEETIEEVMEEHELQEEGIEEHEIHEHELVEAHDIEGGLKHEVEEVYQEVEEEEEEAMIEHEMEENAMVEHHEIHEIQEGIEMEGELEHELEQGLEIGQQIVEHHIDQGEFVDEIEAEIIDDENIHGVQIQEEEIHYHQVTEVDTCETEEEGAVHYLMQGITSGGKQYYVTQYEQEQ